MVYVGCIAVGSGRHVHIVRIPENITLSKTVIKIEFNVLAVGHFYLVLAVDYYFKSGSILCFLCYAHKIIFQNVNTPQAKPILKRIMMYFKLELGFIEDVSVFLWKADIKSVKHRV